MLDGMSGVARGAVQPLRSADGLALDRYHELAADVALDRVDCLAGGHDASIPAVLASPLVHRESESDPAASERHVQG